MRKLLLILFTLINSSKLYAVGCAGTGSCFWVCGLAGGNTNTTTCWATLTGGIVTGSVPTAADNCIFDASTGGTGTATINAALACKAINTTGFAGTIAGSSAVTIAGAFTSGSTTTWTSTSTFTATATSGSFSITSNGNTSGTYSLAIGSGASTAVWSLADNFITTGTLSLVQGTFQDAGKNVTAKIFDTNNSNTRAIVFGGGTYTISGDDTTGTTIKMGTTNNLTLTGQTSGSVLVLNQHSSTSTFALSEGEAVTVPNVRVTGNSGVTHRFTIGIPAVPPNGFNGFSIDTSAMPHTLLFTAGRRWSTKTFTISGTAGNLDTIVSSVSGSAFTISSAGNNVTSFIEDYLSLKDSRCEGTCCVAGAHSTNVSGNTGWIFAVNTPVCPTGSEFGGGI